MRTARGSTRNSRELSCRNSDTKTICRRRIGLVESDPLSIIGCQTAFESSSAVEMVVTTINGLLLDRSLAIGLLGKHRGPNLRETVALLRRTRPELKLILLTTGYAGGNIHNYDAGMLVGQGFGEHSQSYCVHESCTPQDLRRIVEASLAPIRLESCVAESWDSASARDLPRPQHLTREPMQVTRREQQVLEQLLQAGSNREIAERLGIEERTVKCHIARLMRKAGVNNRTSLSFYALQRQKLENPVG
jgi:DNA-binding NarL/FixJ family response regulator